MKVKFLKINPKLLLIILVLGTMLESKKCKKDAPPVVPTGPTKTVTLRIGSYGKYPIGSLCSTAPSLGSRPDSDAGNESPYYTSAFNQKHYTTIELKWSDAQDPYSTIVWSNGNSYTLTVPSTIPLNKALIITVVSKEKCSNCAKPTFNSPNVRAIWRGFKSFSTAGVDNNVLIDLRYDTYANDSYCN